MARTGRWGAVLLVSSLVGSGCTGRRLILDDESAGTEGDSSGTADDDSTDSGQPPPPPGCGNGVADGSEACDGTDLRGLSCETLGLGLGTLACRFDCQDYDVSGCSNIGCGNGVAEPGEVCDGLDLDGQTCASLGLPGGSLACLPGCAGFDTSGCVPTLCGNGVVELGEACDGLDLGGVSCAALGLGEGLLTCTPDCLGFDTSGCGDGCADSDLGGAVGPGVAAGNTIGDDDDLPQACAADGGADHVLRFVPPIPGWYELDTFGSDYDTALSVYANCNPASLLACNDDSARSLQSQIFLLLDVDREVFVSVDGFAGDVGDWVLSIIPPLIPPLPACAEQDLGWSVGGGVAVGDTFSEDEDLQQSCAGGGAVDHVIRFIAPASGTYVFDTLGSSYDTALSIHDGCGPGTELACNDDFDGLLSQIVIDLSAGQSVLVAVSGFAGEVGSWVLNVTPP